TAAMLHIRCGDDIRDRLAEAGLPGRFLRWCDPLCQGPTPALDPAAWHLTRAAFIAENYGLTAAEAARRLAEEEAGLDAWRDHDEIVLWFEHDMFDQLVLARLLDWFGARSLGSRRLSLVCIGAWPGIER